MLYLLTFALSLLLFWLYFRIKMGGFQQLAGNIIHKAELECEVKKRDLMLKIQELQHQHKNKIDKELLALQEREKAIEQKQNSLLELEKRAVSVASKEQEIEKRLEEIAQIKLALKEQLLQTSQLTKESASLLYMSEIEKEMGSYLLERKEEMEKNCEREATKILTTAIGRLALPLTCEVTVSSVALPSEDIKRRIIGREGRNIRLLEQLTGVNYLLDETPGAVVISSADPVRRSVAKLALGKLIADGRIHASFIEEVVKKAEKEVQNEGVKAATKCAFELGIDDLHPEIVAKLGELHFRYSMGQNLLEHSQEVGFLMKLIAAELKLDELRAAKMGLLHDIGKAISCCEGKSHALAGYEFLLKHDVSIDVANGVGAHHGEIVPLNLEAHLVKLADTISAARPGARRESIERYIKRVKTMERICMNLEEVEKAYALQAGREVRVIVKPERVSDSGAQALARTLVTRLEKELPFSGKIKVIVIREKKIIDYAS